ncbi:ABC transporter permease [Compostibacter hankyongensis]|uniref:ABC transporter permease n=1 Tax=Compostibacter hankyongensis TaxID=1007089 RepID=A0ABP8FCG5_9BACT
MFKTFFITLLRNLWRNRLFTLLNVFGLSICICVAWIIFRMVSYEYSYDKKIPGADNIYQLFSTSKTERGEAVYSGAGVPKPVYSALKNEVSGLDLVVPMFYKYNHMALVTRMPDEPPLRIESSDKDIQLVSTVPGYFELLHYKWLAGDKRSALDAPDKLVLTDTRAGEYFPALRPEEVIGKTIIYDDTIVRRVSAVVAQLAAPNSFSKDNNEFIPISKADITNSSWGATSSNDLVFIKPARNSDVRNSIKQLNVLNRKHNKEMFDRYKYESWFDVTALKDKHFETNLNAQTRTANRKVLNGLMIVGAFLLLLACINYINLSTALLPRRSREIGIRKTLGSSSGRIISGFIGETFFVTILAATLSFFFVLIAVKVFAAFLPDGLLTYMNYKGMALFMLSLIIVVSLLSGFYPAWLATKVDTVNVLKGATEKVIGRNKITFRKGLVVFQFLVAQVFIIGAVIIHRQLQYVLHADPGFNKEAVVNVDIPYRVSIDPKYKDKQFILKHELDNNPAVADVSLGNRPMDNAMIANMLSYYQDGNENQQQVQVKYGDTAYLRFYGFHLLAGRNFNPSDTMREVVINEKAVKAYGFKSPEDALGKFLVGKGDDPRYYPIVGVIADFHHFGFQSQIDPLLLTASKDQLRTLNIKLPPQSQKWHTAIHAVEKEWKAVYGDVPFSYKFYDQKIKTLYESERKTQTLVSAATVIAILISCLGLFGLAALTAFQRTKEVGIRKVLGASVSGIVRLLSKEFVVLVFISIIIATPISWWLMNRWLQDFSYRIDIQWWMLLFAGFIAVVIALLTVSFQAIKRLPPTR